MVQKRTCDYTGEEIEPGTGTMFVKTDGTVLWFKDSKARKNYMLGRESRDLEWIGYEEDEGAEPEEETAEAEEEEAEADEAEQEADDEEAEADAEDEEPEAAAADGDADEADDADADEEETEAEA
jgi:large subunit ribosomal protein L24e